MISLHTHSTYSFLDGYGTPEQYIERLKEIGETCMALTDHGNVFGHRPFYRAFKKAGMKLIPGCEMYVSNPKGRYYHITVLASSNIGYENMCKLVSLSNQPDHIDARPMVSFGELCKHKEGLIILTGCFGDGAPHRAYLKDKERVLKTVLSMKRIFKNSMYLEVQHTDLEELKFMRMIGQIADVPVVPTLDVHYPSRAQYKAEDAMLCIGTNSMINDKGRMRLTGNLWLMSTEEALDAGFTTEEIEMTHAIADRCNVELPILKPVTIEGARETMVEIVRAQAKRLGSTVKTPVYRKRYLYEMSIIDKLGLHAYFVVMADVINEFKRRGVFIGPARGSSAGSLVCYLMGITEVDPIAYDLKFERFLDMNRADYPDIDTDFPPSCREEVIEYLKDRFGHDKVGRICSFHTYKGSSVFWDIARIYGFGSDLARELGKAVPVIANDTVDMDAILATPAVKEVVDKWPEFKLASDLEGQVRQLGKHASGYAISPVNLSEVVAEVNAGGEMVLSVDKVEAEAMGLLKLDILGLNTLDMMQAIMKDVSLTNSTMYRLKADEDKVFQAFRDLKVAGIFQFEGAAVKRVLKEHPVHSLEDLTFVNAVARPGAALTLDSAMIPPKPFLPMVYKNRYFVYQEELMSILAYLHFGWDEITTFRKLVSKKKVNELAERYHSKFVCKCVEIAGIDEKEAQRFWVIINRCGEYMFNKSHAVAYAMLAYQAMWLKVNWPDQFTKHYLNATKMDSKRRDIVREYIKEGGKFSVYDKKNPTGSFEVRDGTIIGSLLAIKGIGPAKMKAILEGKVDRGVVKAIEKARENPAEYAPWACLEGFNNKYTLGCLPEGEYIVTARVWEVKDGHCIMEDINGSEKAYFNPAFVEVQEGRIYRLAVSKYKYAKIDSARPYSMGS